MKCRHKKLSSPKLCTYILHIMLLIQKNVKFPPHIGNGSINKIPLHVFLNPRQLMREGPQVGKCDEYQIIKLMMIM